MYVNNTKNKAVLFAYTLNSRFNEDFNNVKLQGLDPLKTYSIREINVANDGKQQAARDNGKSYTGEYLMKVGLSIGSGAALTSTVYEITE